MVASGSTCDFLLVDSGVTFYVEVVVPYLYCNLAPLETQVNLPITGLGLSAFLIITLSAIPLYKGMINSHKY